MPKDSSLNPILGGDGGGDHGATAKPSGSQASPEAASHLRLTGFDPSRMRGQIESKIEIWSMRPSPLSAAGQCWEDGARQGWNWAIDHFEARAALDRMKAREGEDVDKWAERLAADSVRIGEAEYHAAQGMEARQGEQD